MKSSLPVILILSAFGLGIWLMVASAPRTHVVTQETSVQPTNTIPVSAPKPSAPTPVETVPSDSDTSPRTDLPPSVTLPVEFASQAPLGTWVLPYEEFCEETSSLIVAHYALGKPMPSRADIDDELLKIKAYEEKTLGFYEDTTAKETTTILTGFYALSNVKLVSNPTADDIKGFLADGKAVIVPAAGQELGSPYYQAPGPLYHMIVVKGYTPDGYFITEDPGTNTKGENYKFKISTIMDAMHDWNATDIDAGAKVVIVVGKQ